MSGGNRQDTRYNIVAEAEQRGLHGVSSWHLPLEVGSQVAKTDEQTYRLCRAYLGRLSPHKHWLMREENCGMLL